MAEYPTGPRYPVDRQDRALRTAVAVEHVDDRTEQETDGELVELLSVPWPTLAVQKA